MKIDRMIFIIMILLERKRVSIPELAKICEVAPRTIQRDLDAINQAGVPIVSYPGVGGGVGIMENYKLEKRLFSTSDIITLLMSLGSVRSSLPGDEVVSTLAKIQGMIPEEQREAIELQAGRITIDTSPWLGGRSHHELVGLVETAIEKHRLVQFAYTDGKLNKSQRTVEPYRLILKAMNWYFEGYCLDRQDFRFFKLSRMAETVLTEETFEPRPFSPQQVVRLGFGDTQGTLAATLRIRGRAVNMLLETFGPECIEPESEDTWIAQVPVFDSEAGYKSLLNLGTDCECLAPQILRENFVRYLAKVSDIYAPERTE